MILLICAHIDTDKSLCAGVQMSLAILLFWLNLIQLKALNTPHNLREILSLCLQTFLCVCLFYAT